MSNLAADREWLWEMALSTREDSRDQRRLAGTTDNPDTKAIFVAEADRLLAMADRFNDIAHRLTAVLPEVK